LLKEELDANALSVAAKEVEVAGKSEVVSRRWLVSVVENDNARSQLIGWFPRWLDVSSESVWLPENPKGRDELHVGG
jgi:hypothetical protein